MQIRAFTMLESLLVLGIVSLLALGLSSSVQSTFAAVEEQIFFMEFEELYRETQKRSLASQQKMNLMLEERSIGNGYQKLAIPKTNKLSNMVKALIRNCLTCSLFCMVFLISFCLLSSDASICL